jgi:ATP-grasp domain, R2K clade family 2
LRTLRSPIPVPVDYPRTLEHFHERKIWRSTIGEVRRAIENGGPPVFVKPADRRKRFTGIIVSGPEDLWRLAPVSRSLRVHCSEVVDWQTEWRAFVNDATLVGLRRYDGDLSVVPDLSAMRSMIVELAVPVPLFPWSRRWSHSGQR